MSCVGKDSRGSHDLLLSSARGAVVVELEGELLGSLGRSTQELSLYHGRGTGYVLHYIEGGIAGDRFSLFAIPGDWPPVEAWTAVLDSMPETPRHGWRPDLWPGAVALTPRDFGAGAY